MHFITDVQGNEPELLTPSLATQTLRILVQSASDYPPIEFPAPEGGWTHQQLCDLHLGLPERACADAYLGMEWIGSTEV